MNSSWFRDAAFGAFIHWGLYAVPGGIWKGKETPYIGEWLQARMRIPNAEYETLTPQFDPELFDADEWVRLFAAAGMKYIVFTAKHHEGFSMFRTKVSPFNIVDATPFKRDPLAELSAACRKYGLKLGIYYSHCLDWHEADAADPGDSTKNIDGTSWGNNWDFPDRSQKVFERYFRGKVIPQIKELLSNYGPVSVLWFDCSFDITKEQCCELRELVHGLQPDCLINGRIGHGCQDYMSLGDNQMPATAIPGLVECPATLNDTWGFKWNDHNWKKPEEIIGQLLTLAEKKVTFLLNVGPRPDGKFTPETIDILSKIAEWCRNNGDALYRTDGTPFAQHIEGVRILRDGKNLHFYPQKDAGKMTFSGITAKAVRCPVPYHQTGQVLELDFSGIPVGYPDICVEFDAVPEVEKKLMPQNGELTLSASAGTIHPGDGKAAYAVIRDADGNEVRTNEHMAKSASGQLFSWHNPSDRMEWNAEITEPGTYRVRIVTQSGRHSFAWVGAREVELTCGSQKISAPLAIYGKSRDKYYPCAESLLGEMTFTKAEPVTFSMRTVNVTSPDALFMGCIKLILKKV